jgi:hypothetical protein
MQFAKATPDKRLRKMPNRVFLASSGSGKIPVRRMLHTDSHLTESDSGVRLIRHDAGSETSGFALVQRTSQTLFSLRDCFLAGPEYKARSTDSKTSLSRNHLSRTEAPSRTRRVKPVVKCDESNRAIQEDN